MKHHHHAILKAAVHRCMVFGVLFMLGIFWGHGVHANRLEEIHIIRIHANPFEKIALAQISPKFSIDYGSFLWLDVESADLAFLEKSGASFEVVSEPYTLMLGGERFDPMKGQPSPPFGWGSSQGSGPDLHLVQFTGPTKDSWLESLRFSAIEIVQYVHPFTYVVWGDAETLRTTLELDFVRWTGPFFPAYRVLPQWRNLSGDSILVNVLVYRAAGVDRVIEDLIFSGAALTGRGVLDGTWESVGLLIPGDKIVAAAQVPGVYSIQPVHTDGGLRGEMSNQINVGNYDGGNLAFPGYLNWLDQIGLDGAGVLMANVDGGVDELHPDLINRFLPCTGVTCSTAIDSHGTHTAGIMAADGSTGNVDSNGFLRGLGMAPGAFLIEQRYFPYYTWPNGMLLLIKDSAQNGAVLSGNSWGPSGTPKGYDDDTMQVDIGVRDADPDTPGSQQFSYVLSFMNGYGGTSSQGTPDEAKNIFNIGSTKMQNSNASQILEINDLSANSAHGPALDGRTIPHLVAPGCSVDSTDTSTSGYGLKCGTSMASPHVSGAVGLFIERYREVSVRKSGLSSDPSPALIKAAFLPVAHDLAGNHDSDGGILGHPFDSKQGWGRLDVAAVLAPQVEVVYYDNPAIFDETGETWRVDLVAVDPTQPVKIMLAWTDAPGHGLGGATPAWNNDLDLQVEYAGESYSGNAFGPDGWSIPSGIADGINNTEGVFLGPSSSGAFTIEVLAANINSDGIPQMGDTTDQDFALVCYNCQPFAEVVLLPPEQTHAGNPGDNIVYQFTLRNMGGVTDSYLLTLLGAEWKTSGPDTVGPLAHLEEVTLNYTVTIPIDIESTVIATDTFTLAATSVLSPSVYAQAAATTMANVFPGIDIGGDGVGFGKPGETVTHTVRITNTGDYTDTFSIAIKSDWFGDLSANTTSLLPPLSEPFTLIVEIYIPAGAQHNDHETAMLTVTSGLDSGISETWLLVTKALEYKIFLPFIR